MLLHFNKYIIILLLLNVIPPTMQWSCLQLQTTNHCYCNVLDIATLWLFSMEFSSLIIPRACFKIGFELWIYNHIIEVLLLWFFIVYRLKISWSSITTAKLLVYFQVNLQQHVTMSGTWLLFIFNNVGNQTL